MLELWRKGRPVVPPEAVAAPVERPATDALIPRSRRRHYPKVIMTLVLGLDEAALRPLLAETTAADPVAAAGDEAPPLRPLEPLFVTDCTAFALFRAAGVIFEYLPGPTVQRRHAPELAWDVYLARRLERLRHKWAPVRIVAIGSAAREVLARQLVSPFSSPDLSTLIGGGASAVDFENKG